MEVRGKIAIVTGAAAGIGRAVATALATEGAAVVLADVDNDEGRRAAEELGGRFVHADVLVDDDLRALVAAAEGLEILVNNAGGAPGPNYPEASIEHWSRTLELNLRSTMVATQLALEAMTDGGAIVNVSSMAGYGLYPHGAPEYAAAKAGVMRLSGALSPLGASAGIRVSCVCPDWVDTPAVHRSLASMTDEERAQVPELVTAEEIASLVLDLIRDDTSAGRVLIRPADGPAMVVPLEGPCG
ncbi:MAG TPA: SDR family oxidoreductase [Gaiellaceae bacterium]|nr:SDR family oxidoreductase [Gaiellaceae bacterium]